jgi:hypothetical protein
VDDYYSIIVRAVSRLPSKTDEARHGIYERARTALQEKLRTLDPRSGEWNRTWGLASSSANCAFASSASDIGEWPAAPHTPGFGVPGTDCVRSLRGCPRLNGLGALHAVSK